MGIAAVAILLITIIGNQQFFESYHSYFGMNQMLKYALNIAGLSAIAIVGYWGWCADERRWLRSLWMLLYVIFAIVFLVYGVVDKFVSPWSLYAKADFRFYRNLLFSPLPFMLLFVISIVFKAGNTAVNSKE